MFEIVAAHGIKYAATASIGYLADFMNKVQHASEIKGTKYIHVIAPCPTGWGIATDETVEIAAEAVDCGLWVLAEYENGGFKVNIQPKAPEKLVSHLRKQGRFRHLTDKDIAVIEASRGAKWDYIRKNWNGSAGASE